MYNIYCLEMTISDKTCLEDDHYHSSHSYKKFLSRHSAARVETVYKLKLEKSSESLSSWVNVYEPDWNKQCPFKKTSIGIKSLKPKMPLRRIIEEENRLKPS